MREKNQIQRRTLLKIIALVTGSGLFSPFSYALKLRDKPIDSSTPPPPKTPVVTIDMGCPVIDYSGTAKPYQPPIRFGE